MATVGWSGFWGDNASVNGSYTTLVNKNPRRNGIRRSMDRESFRQVTALFNALIGTASGSNVTATHSRVSAEPPYRGGGGSRTIDTITDLNRNTTAADIALLKEMTVNVTTRPSYPADLGGNGGKAFT